MKCPEGTVEVSFWFPKSSIGGIYFDTERDSASYGQCAGYIEPDYKHPERQEMFHAILARVRPVLDLMIPKHKMDTDYYTLTPEEFEAITEGVDYEVPERNS